MNPIDPFTVEVVHETLVSIVREMRTNLVRTAYSSVIYEGHDFSCALMSPSGQLIAQAEDNPSHLFPIRWSVRFMRERYGEDIHPGDIFLHNDPYTGGTHNNDIALLYPLFFEGEMLVFPVVRAHWGDVGGMTPGSISGQATETYQEGVRIPLIRLYHQGEPNQEVLDLLFSNMRVPFEREGDLRAMVGTCKVAEERLHSLVDNQGRSVVRDCLQRLLDRAETRMRQMISQIRDGEYFYEGYLDSSGASPDPVLIKAKLTVRGDTIDVDFEGSSPQVEGPTNAGPAVVPSAVFTALKSFLDPRGPVNDGAIAPVTIHVPEGTVTNASLPAACGANTEIRRCAESVVMGALAQALPEEITGDVKGTSNHCYISGSLGQTRERFIFYEYPAGGTGGFLGGDGNNATRSFLEGDFNAIQPIESVEIQFPLRIERCELRTDSGGSGKTRGGLGLRRDVKLLAEQGSLSVVSDKNIIPPFGVLGGESAAPNAFTVLRDGAELQPSAIPGKVTAFPLKRGDTVVMRSSGGGGYDDPLHRDAHLVCEDVRQGYVSGRSAREKYGVVMARGEVLRQETDQLRRQLAGARDTLRLHPAPGLEQWHGRRIGKVNPATSAQLGVGALGLVELVNPRGGPLRVWIRPCADVEEGWIHLGPTALRILQRSPGEESTVRVLHPGAQSQALKETSTTDP